jgi:hypothetical protein
MGAPQTFPDAAAARAAGTLLNLHSPAEIATAIEVLIDLLDQIGGDPDLEPNGDELDSTGAEDDFCVHNVPFALAGPGCPLADPDMAVDDEGCDDENDDREEDEVAHPRYGIDQSHQLPWQPANDIRARKPHRDRIRREQCIPTSWGGFRLKAEPTMIVLPKRRRRRLPKQTGTPAVTPLA